jgi:hypothetical protein
VKHFAIFVFKCFFCLKAFSQGNCLRWEESKRLQLTDFLGFAKDTSSFDAESFSEIRYTYAINSVSKLSFEVHANFDRNSSWIKKGVENDELLRHEQLHFDIAELFARKIKLAFEEYHFTANYPSEIHQIFNEQKAKYHLMQKRYDEETDHSVNIGKQIEWENYVAMELVKKKETLNEKANEYLLVDNK